MKKSSKFFDAATLKRIDTALNNWPAVDPRVCGPVDAELATMERHCQAVIETMENSARLAPGDLNIFFSTRA